MSHHLFEYSLKRSKRRKTVAIKVQHQQLTVYAPHYVSQDAITQWLTAQAPWITQQLSKQKLQTDTRQYPFRSHQVKLFAESISLEFVKGKVTRWQFNSAQQSVTLMISGRVKKHDHGFEQQLMAFLQQQLENYIEMRIAHYCYLMDEPLPEQLVIRPYKRRWGSCNSRRELTFNIHLASAPTWVIDYVIVHELAHLRYLNHSREFWLHVSDYYPDYKKATQWLKHHGTSLQWVFE